ncbi:MAG: GIY-YIG nuclease family protein [Synechococcaceae cyanobacterium]|nr:GIY-YIG nuclease family protein [Synechococcaceae cyanobacterium]
MSRQGDLFADHAGAGMPLAGAAPQPLPPPLLRHQLQAWQARVAAHQGPLFARQEPPPAAQGLLFEPGAAGGDAAALPADPEAAAAALDPLGLAPQSLSFWRWPSAPHRGAALYLVLDRPADPSPPLLLYVGETGRADRRWKGDHDCKSYLAAYGEALAAADLPARLSIRFWLDVPAAIGSRRALEQALIRRWLPPFNKETRGRWATPFTADGD